MTDHPRAERRYTESEVLLALAGLTCVLQRHDVRARERDYDGATGTLVDDDGGAYWDCLLEDWRCDECRRYAATVE